MSRSLTKDYRTLRQIVQEALFEDIMQGRFKPGERLVEAELTELYGVSRGPLREAIRTLEGQGLVKSISNKGVVVTQLTRREVQEIYEIRISLECLATRLAVPNLTEAQLTQIENILNKMTDSTADPKQWLRLNNDYHLALYAAADRPRLCNYLDELMKAVELYVRRFLDLPGKLLDTHADHHLIFETAKKRDVEQCEKYMKMHLESGAKIIISLAPEDNPA